jgi:acetyltransferase
VVDREKLLNRPEGHQHLVITPYPKKYETAWKLRDGRSVLLRPIKPEDEPMWLEMFQSFSEESIRLRFFQVIKDTPHEVRVRYCNIDYDREIAIVAELNEEGKRRLLGIARVGLEPDGKSGELAFIVADAWQGLGLGTKLVDHALEVAEDMKVESVYALMLRENTKAISLMRKMGFEVQYQGDGTAKAVLKLKAEEAPSATEPEAAAPPLSGETGVLVPDGPAAEELAG